MKKSMKNEKRTNDQGFTLLEILLVVALIAILASIVIFAINPGRQLAQARNAQRKVDVNTILNAVYQYALDNGGNMPVDISVVENSDECPNTNNAEICQTGASENCNIDLSGLTENGKYLVSMPVDPNGSNIESSGNGYNIIKDNNNRVTVCAPKAELGDIISVTR